MAGKLFGRAHIRINGVLVKSNEGAKCNPGGTQKNTVTHNDGIDYSEELVPARIEFDRLVDSDFTIDDIRNAATIPVVFECDSGQQYVGDMWLTNVPDLTSGKNGGTANYVLEGPELKEVK